MPNIRGIGIITRLEETILFLSNRVSILGNQKPNTQTSTSRKICTNEQLARNVSRKPTRAYRYHYFAMPLVQSAQTLSSYYYMSGVSTLFYLVNI